MSVVVLLTAFFAEYMEQALDIFMVNVSAAIEIKMMQWNTSVAHEIKFIIGGHYGYTILSSLRKYVPMITMARR